ncbi:NAD(P)-binding domain [Cordyceps militaris]|uniref:NAD(P)-binding domain n=1 Tax=Cordyceps militaris TaxID=73501 RepID=A0A2H4SH71_CORMI|nr:NAD(P)-binding domain [Cordyceps militaris]
MTLKRMGGNVLSDLKALSPDLVRHLARSIHLTPVFAQVLSTTLLLPIKKHTITNMSSPTVVLVTGANSGIGYEIVKSFYEAPKSYHVIMTSRSLENGTKAMEKIKSEVPSSSNTLQVVQMDLTSDESINAAFATVQSTNQRIDALINNAGATFDIQYSAGEVSLRDCFNQAYDVNVTGTTIATHTFLPLLLRSADPRLLFLAGLSQITEAAKSYFPTPTQPAGWPKPPVGFETIGYRCSKTALNMLMLDWNHKLRADGVRVWAVGPGMLATNLGGKPELVAALNLPHPRKGGRLMRAVVEGERDGDAGQVISYDGRMPL